MPIKLIKKKNKKKNLSYYGVAQESKPNYGS